MKGIVSILAVMLFVAIPTLGQNASSSAQAAPVEQSIEVVKFDIRAGVEFPASTRDVMMTEIVDELTKLKKFTLVLGDVAVAGAAKKEEPVTEAPAATDVETKLVLTGTVTQFNPGNRAARYLIGFGAGKTKVVAEIKLVERATGKVVLEKKVDGSVIIGLFGGDSNGATRGLAEEVASVTKKALFKK